MYFLTFLYRLEVWYEGDSRHAVSLKELGKDLLQNSLLASAHCFACSSITPVFTRCSPCVLPAFRFSLFIRTINGHIELRAHPITIWPHLNSICNDTMSKYGHILKYWMVGLQHLIFWVTQINLYRKHRFLSSLSDYWGKRIEK